MSTTCPCFYPMPPTRLLIVALAKLTIESEYPCCLRWKVSSKRLSNASSALAIADEIVAEVTGFGDDFELNLTSN